MTLLVLSTEGPSDLLDPYHRIRVANEVNAALLQAQSQESGAKLPALLKLLLWAQDQLAQRAAFPRLSSLVEASFEARPEDDLAMQQ